MKNQIYIILFLFHFNLSLRTKIEFARIKSPSWRSKDFFNVKEQKIERVLSVKATKREKEIKCCLFSPACGCLLKVFQRQKESVWKGEFLIPEYEIFWIYLVWGCISSDATNLHKIYKSKKETFILLKGRESDQI